MYDRNKFLFQACAADQTAVNILHCEQLCRIFAVDTAAVLDTNFVRNFLAVQLCQNGTNCMQTSCACAEVAVLPVPIAQIGS